MGILQYAMGEEGGKEMDTKEKDSQSAPLDKHVFTNRPIPSHMGLHFLALLLGILV